MIYSSPYNSFWFKNLGGTYPNSDNTLHNNLKIGGIKSICYSQKVNNNHVSYLQFYSDVNTDITVTVSASGVTTIIDNVLTISNYGGGIYFFNYKFTASSDYYEKEVIIVVTQGIYEITSESIIVEDLTEDLANGRIMYAKYTNKDKQDNEIMNLMIDWSVIDNVGNYMDFFIEAQTNELNALDTVKVMKTVVNNILIASSLFSGSLLKTGELPEYMIKKLAVCSSLDVFELNNLSYIKQSGIKNTTFGNSNLSQIELPLLQKNALGVNVDSLGLVQPENMAEYHKTDGDESATSSFSVEEPVKYYTGIVTVEQLGTPTTNPIKITLGYGGVGTSDIGTYRIYNDGVVKSLTINRRGSFSSASDIYVGIPSVAGNIMKVKFNFQLQDIT